AGLSAQTSHGGAVARLGTAADRAFTAPRRLPSLDHPTSQAQRTNNQEQTTKNKPHPMKARRMKSIYDFLPEPLAGQMIQIVDIGASPIDGDPTYKPLLAAGRARVTGFEPNPAALAELQQSKGPNETYLPDAIGDGAEHTLHVCQSAGMSSLLRPNQQILK